MSVYVSYELKEHLTILAQRYDRTMADLVRGILKIGIPMMEGISRAEELMAKEYIELFRKLRRVRRLDE